MFSKLQVLRQKKTIKNPRMRLLNELIKKHQMHITTQTEINDIELFRKEVDGIIPMIDDHAYLIRRKPKQVIIKAIESEPQTPIFSETTQWLSLECPQQLSWVKHGYDPNLVKRLRTGKCSIDHTIDLHGQTIARASLILQDILNMMSQQHLRFLLVVHGKGSHLNSNGVIKSKVNEWLRTFPRVIAFASAPLKWGDTGATVVMLGAYGNLAVNKNTL